jgi:hypothetical protein
MKRKTRREFIGDVSKITAGTLVGGAILGKGIKKAFAQPLYRGKVVVVYDENALDSSRRINKDVVKRMIEEGIKELTGQNDLTAAYNLLLPDIQANDRIGIKVNPLASNRGLRTPEVTESIIESLKGINVSADNIVIWDKYRSHLSRDYTINETGPGVKCYNPRFTVQNESARPQAGRFSQILADARYIINAPVLKCHAYSNGSIVYGLTFVLKNYVGAIEVSNSVCDNRDWWDRGYVADINTQPQIKEKSRLIVGAALKSSTRDHVYASPNFFPKKILIASDPVACDAVGLEILREYKGGDTNSLYYRRARTYIERADQQFNLGESNLDNIERIEIDTTNISSIGKKREKLAADENLSYPNPANPSVHLPYSVGQFKRTRIRIYNKLGQLIREIDLGRRKGKGVVYWDGRDGGGTEVPSGMYFYEVVGEGVRKMIVLR